MGQNNSELISNIARQFASQITPGFLRTLNFTSGYFNAGRTLDVENQAITNQDPSVLNRIFDSVIVDTATRAQFYKAVIDSQNPIDEILLPLIDAIEKKIMNSDRTGLNSTISADFKKYAEIQKLFSDNDTFRDVMLRAIASACSANLADFVSRKIKPLMRINSEANQLEIQSINRVFSSKISLPFDNYIGSLTAEKFQTDLNSIFSARPPQVQDGVQQDRHWFVAMVLKAFQNLIYLLSGQGSKHQGDVLFECSSDVKRAAMSSEIEPRVQALLFVANNVVETIRSCEKYSELLANVEKFSIDLSGLIMEIDDRRELKMSEEPVETGFKSLCANFSKILDSQIQDQQYGEQEHAEVMGIVNELTKQVSPSRSTTPGPEDPSCDDQMVHRGP
jgi:hypothetical protein